MSHRHARRLVGNDIHDIEGHASTNGTFVK